MGEQLIAARTRTAHLRGVAPAWLDIGGITAYRTGSLLVAANLTDRKRSRTTPRQGESSSSTRPLVSMA